MEGEEGEHSEDDNDTSNSTDNSLQIGDYCYYDDDDNDIYCVIMDIKKRIDFGDQYKIIDFEENKERIVVKSSLCKIPNDSIKEAQGQHIQYKAINTNKSKNKPQIVNDDGCFQRLSIFLNMISNKIKNDDMQKIWCGLCATTWTIAVLGLLTLVISFFQMNYSSDMADNTIFMATTKECDKWIDVHASLKIAVGSRKEGVDRTQQKQTAQNLQKLGEDQSSLDYAMLFIKRSHKSYAINIQTTDSIKYTHQLGVLQ